jgi:tetratricopeptide (TPR) repeat protein
MAQVEYNKGDYPKQRDYWKQVIDLDPANPDAAFDYARSFQFTNPPQFRQLAEQFAKRFPRNSDASYLLYQLQDAEPVMADRISLLEDMRRSDFDKPLSTAGMDDPDAFTNWLEESMGVLFNLYAKDHPQEALNLAQEMQKIEVGGPGLEGCRRLSAESHKSARHDRRREILRRFRALAAPALGMDRQL